MARTLKGLIRDRRITSSAEWADENPNMTDMPAGSSHWRVRLRHKGKQMTVPFSMGPAHSSEPDTEGVLDCLLSDASSADQSFDDWCGDYGFDTDSRKAERTYRAVVTQTEKLRRFLGEQFDAFLQAER